MPTLNIDVNARIEQARRELRQLDKEVLKISNSEKILEKAMRRAGDVGAKEFKRIQSAAVRQAKAVNTSALQFKQLRSQMARLGASPAAVGKITDEFIRFRKQMERGVVSTTAFQKAQDRLRATMAGTKRQLAKNTVEMKKTGKVGHDSTKQLTNLSTTLENLGSTAVLIAGPLSGVGSRLIAFGAIAKRGSLAVAGMFVALASVSTLLVKSIKQFGELESFLKRVDAILQATGKSAEFTAEQINKIAASVARTTLANLEDTRQAIAGILAFRGVGPGNIEDILRLSQDIASTGFTDLGNAAKTLARAVEDPVRNLDSLRRIFIQLDPATKAQIVSMQNFGERARAAGILLDEVRKKFGGAGEGANVGLKGAVDELGQAWDELKEAFGDSAFYDAVVWGIHQIIDALVGLTGMLKAIKDFEFPSFRGMTRDLKEFLGLAPKSYPIPPLEVTITKGRLSHPPPRQKPQKKLGPISTFDEALIKSQEKANLTMMRQERILERVSRGYSMVHPEVLNLASAHGVLDKAIAALNGELKATTPEMARTIEFVKQANKTFLEMEARIKATNIVLNNRTAITRYKDELRALVNLLYEGRVNTRDFNKEVQKLREAFATPEVKAINSALSTFSDKLADATVKGRDFVENLKAGFKGLVDDILKEFLKLAVINPIMNSIFGKIPSRPELGQEGGGILGIGGMFGRQADDPLKGGANNANNNPFKAINDNFKEKGLEGAEGFAGTMEGINESIKAKGSGFASGLGSTFSDILDGIGNSVGTAIGGGLGSFLGHKFADLLGFQHGGQFKVGGVGGADSKLVAFKATPGEKVSVDTPGQQNKSGNVTYIDARGVDPGQMDRLVKVIKELDSSIEVRAINATADARFRNPSLLGRVA